MAERSSNPKNEIVEQSYPDSQQIVSDDMLSHPQSIEDAEELMSALKQAMLRNFEDSYPLVGSMIVSRMREDHPPYLEVGTDGEYVWLGLDDELNDAIEATLMVRPGEDGPDWLIHLSNKTICLGSDMSIREAFAVFSKRVEAELIKLSATQ